MGEDTTATLKRPAAAASEDVREGTDEAQEVNQAVDARAAVKDVNKQKRILTKLETENERLLEKIKNNKTLIRKESKQLDELKDIAQNKSRKLGDKLRKSIRKKMVGKVNRAKDKVERVENRLKAVRKRYNKTRKSAGKVKGRAGDVEANFKRAERSYDDAKKLCARLKKEGDDVPDEGDKDLSAPGAFKPPGVKAALARDNAKREFLKMKAIYEKAAAPAGKKEEMLKALKEKMKSIEEERDKADEEIKAAGKLARQKKAMKR